MKFQLQEYSELFRYDLSAPPTSWDMKYKNPEYVNSEKGSKNQIGAFFFFNSKEQASNTAHKAIERYPTKNYNKIWITQAVVKSPVNLLDLRRFTYCSGLLATLQNKGYDIMSSSFRKYGLWESYENAKEAVDLIISISEKDPNWALDKEKDKLIQESINRIEDVIGLPNEYIGGLCQQFTDFGNGFAFKDMLQEKGFEGYIFNESNHAVGSDTVCLLSAEKLEEPVIVDYQEI